MPQKYDVDTRGDTVCLGRQKKMRMSDHTIHAIPYMPYHTCKDVLENAVPYFFILCFQVGWRQPTREKQRAAEKLQPPPPIQPIYVSVGAPLHFQSLAAGMPQPMIGQTSLLLLFCFAFHSIYANHLLVNIAAEIDNYQIDKNQIICLLIFS